MAKVLVVRKPDKTIHIVPLANKARLMNFNRNLPTDKKWRIEEVEEKEAVKLPFIDDSYVTAEEAKVQVEKLDKALSEKDQLIKDLEAKLAAMGNTAPAPVAPGPKKNT